MRKFLFVTAALVLLPAFAALAEQPGTRKSERAVTSGKTLPLKGAASGNPCAAYGAGFVKVEGTDTCVKIGGAVSIGAGASSGSR
jgi:hypothetical protein